MFYQVSTKTADLEWWLGWLLDEEAAVIHEAETLWYSAETDGDAAAIEAAYLDQLARLRDEIDAVKHEVYAAQFNDWERAVRLEFYARIGARVENSKDYPMLPKLYNDGYTYVEAVDYLQELARIMGELPWQQPAS